MLAAKRNALRPAAGMIKLIAKNVGRNTNKKCKLLKLISPKYSFLLTVLIMSFLPFFLSYFGMILTISCDFTAASISASQSSLLSDSKILASFGFVVGCFGRNTVQQSSYG